jgi:hypothetical protein
MSDFYAQDRIKFELAVPISGWARLVHPELFLSKSLIRGENFDYNSLLYAMLH